MHATFLSNPDSTSSMTRASRPARFARLCSALVGLAMLLAAGGALAANEQQAEAFIQKLGDDAIGVLSDASLDEQQKLDELKTLLTDATDVDLVARLAIKKYWREMSPEQQQEYTKLFNQLLINTLAERMSWYSGQTMKIDRATDLNERDTLVDSQIIRTNNKPPFPVQYLVRFTDGTPLLLDVYAERVSMLRTQFDEAQSVINRSGIDGYLAELRKRASSSAEGLNLNDASPPA